MHRLTNNDWVDYYNVTNYSGGYGISPTVSVSPSRVHVGYNSGSILPDYYFLTGIDEMSRTKYNDTWQPQQTISNNGSQRGKIFAASSKLYDFYYEFVGGEGQFRSDLYYRNRNYGSNTWSTASLLEIASDVTTPLVFCETANENIHTYTASYEVKERIIVNGSVGSSSNISSGGGIYGLGVSSAYNDIYLVWNRGAYLEYRQYDANPESPQNLYSSSSVGSHPQINWKANETPDIQEYRVYKRDHPNYGTWQYLGSTTNSYFIDNSETIVVGHQIANEINKYYCVKAVDQNNNLSNYSNILEIRVEGYPQFKLNNNGENESIAEYQLFSNYPNPFNPTTEINYQIPKDGFVSLTIYNTLGEIVSNLVNEYLQVGRYTVQFNADNLPSGVYIYRLQVNDFVTSKKMMLLK